MNQGGLKPPWTPPAYGQTRGALLPWTPRYVDLRPPSQQLIDGLHGGVTPPWTSAGASRKRTDHHRVGLSLHHSESLRDGRVQGMAANKDLPS